MFTILFTNLTTRCEQFHDLVPMSIHKHQFHEVYNFISQRRVHHLRGQHSSHNWTHEIVHVNYVGSVLLALMYSFQRLKKN